jgi:YfiR/HmsC-like
VKPAPTAPSPIHGRATRRAAGWLRLGLFAAALAPGCLPLRATEASLEYRVKAAFLFNFAKFVEWPPDSLPPGRPLRIGLMGPPGICAEIEASLAGKSVAGHPLVARRVDLSELGADPPQVLFVQRTVRASPAEIAGMLRGRPVLVVGEAPDFAAEGGIIGFVEVDDTLRFQVNLRAALRADLHLSGQLASLAEIVTPQ